MLLLGTDPLTRFLNDAAARPFVWGEFDCLLWLADWILIRRGVDPAENFRGSYSTMLEAARVVRRGGGMQRLVDLQVQIAGLCKSDAAARGDIAIVSVTGEGGEHFGNHAGAILLGGTAAMICQQGLMVPRIADVPLVAAWRV